MKVFLLTGALLAALSGVEGQASPTEQPTNVVPSEQPSDAPTMYDIDCGVDAAGDPLWLVCSPWSKPEGAGGDASEYLGYACTNKRYIPAVTCPANANGDNECGQAKADWDLAMDGNSGECKCPWWACDDHGCEDVACDAALAVMPACVDADGLPTGETSMLVASDPAKGVCCDSYTPCKAPQSMTSVVYKTDPWDRVYQWSHYYDKVTGEPTDSRVPPGWKWNKHAKGAKDFECSALWNKAKNAPDLNANTDDPRIIQMNVCGVGSGVCCVRGWKAAVEFCQVFKDCTLVDFMDEDPSDLTDPTDLAGNDSTHNHFITMLGIADLPNGSKYSFYEAITDPIYVLRGGAVDQASMSSHDPDGDGNKDLHTPDKDAGDYARFWNSCESPMKCPDGTLKDCRGRCYGAPKEYTFKTTDFNTDVAVGGDMKIQAPLSSAAEGAGVWSNTDKCYLSKAGMWWFGMTADGTWWVKNKMKRAADVAAAGKGHCALIDDSIFPGMVDAATGEEVPITNKTDCDAMVGIVDALGQEVKEWVDPVAVPAYTYTDFTDWVDIASAAAEEYDVTISCSYSPYGSCKVYGLDWGNFAEGDCSALWNDYVCDKGQRILSSGHLGPDLNCAKFDFDRGDCECAAGRTMTCSGYCLSDEDCKSTTWGKDKCSDWLTDDVCDYGQRISDMDITMHFECQEWKFDNGACCPAGGVEADGTCTTPQDYQCDATPMTPAGILQSCPADMSNNDALSWSAIPMVPTEPPTGHPNWKMRNNVDIYKVSGDVESIKAELEHMQAEFGSGGMGGGPRYVTDDPAVNRDPPSIHNQEKVWVSYFHSGYFYEAVISNHNGPMGIEVTFVDGDVQMDVERDEIMALEEWDVDALVWMRNEHGDWDQAKVMDKDMMPGQGMDYTLEMPNNDVVNVWDDWEAVRPEAVFMLGDHVWAERDGNLRWFKGVVTGMSQQGSVGWEFNVYEVTYTNGETDLNVRAPMMYLVHPKRIISVAGDMDEAGICQMVTDCPAGGAPAAGSSPLG